jgi:hypothetical protein
MNDVIASAVDERATLNRAEGRIEIGSMEDVDAIGELCARYRPGRRPAKKRGFGFEGAVDDSHRLLLRRSLQGYQRARFTTLGGGFSEARVYRVDAQDASGRTTPFLAKIGPHEAIQTEVETTRDFVADRIPFPNHAPIVHDRCVVGATGRVITERLVDQATRFDEFLGTASEDEALFCVRLTFRGALRVWREGHLRETRHLMQDYRLALKKRVVSEPGALVAAAQRAIEIDDAVIPPDVLLRSAQRWPPLEVGVCLGHGDLQVRNVFARCFAVGGVQRLLDVVLIDFESAGEAFARSRDYATLDVSLALDDLTDATPLSESELDEIFAFESLLSGSRGAGRRRFLIQRLRELATEERIGREEYAVSLIAYLLRYARFTKTQPSDRCAAAYRIAARLAIALDGHFR